MNETIINITNVTKEPSKSNITLLELILYIWTFMYVVSFIKKNKEETQKKIYFY